MSFFLFATARTHFNTYYSRMGHCCYQHGAQSYKSHAVVASVHACKQKVTVKKDAGEQQIWYTIKDEKKGENKNVYIHFEASFTIHDLSCDFGPQSRMTGHTPFFSMATVQISDFERLPTLLWMRSNECKIGSKSANVNGAPGIYQDKVIKNSKYL